MLKNRVLPLLLLLATPALAQEDPLKGSWLVRGEDDRGAYEGTLRFERIDSGRYRAKATLASKDATIDRSYEAPAVLSTATSTLTIYRSLGSGFLGALDKLVIAKGTVTGTNVRVRGGPGTGHQILGVLNKPEKVEVIGRDGDFYKIKRGVDTAYVSALFVKLDAQSPTEWVGTFTGGGPSWDGTWVKNQQPVGTERLARIKEGELNFAAIDLTTDQDSRDFVGRFRSLGWNNLIEKIPQLKDDAHPDMKLDGGVVLPYGRVREINHWTNICDLPSSVAIQNLATAREWLPTAGVRVSKDGTKGQLLGVSREQL